MFIFANLGAFKALTETHIPDALLHAKTSQALYAEERIAANFIPCFLFIPPFSI